jgi:uncharacterized protein (PEP-CTERM system associated)
MARQPAERAWLARSLSGLAACCALLGATSGGVAQTLGLPTMPGSQMPMSGGSLGRPQPGAAERGPTFDVQYGVRSGVLASDASTQGAATQGSASRQSLEITPYLNASWRSATTQASLGWQLRHFDTRTGDRQDSFLRHDLRASLDSLLLGDWLGVQAGASIFNTNATLGGVQSVDPASSAANNAVLRTAFVSPYAQGRLGALATWRLRYRQDHTDTSGGVNAALAQTAHLIDASLAGGPMFNPWSWAVNASGQRREFPGGVSLDSTSALLAGYYVPSSELRLGATLNHLYIERLANASGATGGWGPGLSVDWAPSRRTTMRGAFARQYFGNTGTLAFAHRSQQLVLGAELSRSILQSNSAALLTFNPATVFSAGGFSPALNPLFAQLNAAGLLSSTDVVIGTPIINDALVRNRNISVSAGWIARHWSATATAFRNRRETLISSTVFGVPDALAPAAFGSFDSRGLTLNGSIALGERHSLGLTGLVRESSQSDTGLKVRLSFVQAALNARLDARTSASLALRRSVQTGEGPTAVSSDETALFGVLDFRMR